jgi:hypothetical protein
MLVRQSALEIIAAGLVAAPQIGMGRASVQVQSTPCTVFES